MKPKIAGLILLVLTALTCCGCGSSGSLQKEKKERRNTMGPSPAIQYPGLNGTARNPIISHIFTADPSAKVFNGRVYVYTSHDLDTQKDYRMTDYHVFSSDDLVNWQDHGNILDVKNIPWAEWLYAPDCVRSPADGKYYLYFPNSGNGIGVAVSDRPEGPFTDALGRPLIDRSTPGVENVPWVFDPMCFIDDDGEVYLYFGGGMPGTGKNARVIRLNRDMISLKDSSATMIPAPDYFEAPYMNKREGQYYFSYSTTFSRHPAFIDYMISDNPMTGFRYKGTILMNPPGNNNDNNHHSIIEFGGEWYILYHNRILANRKRFSSYQRSITIDRLKFNRDGTIAEVDPTEGTVQQLKTVDPFRKIEAEMMADQRGIKTADAERPGCSSGVYVRNIQNKTWIGYSQLDFRTGARSFKARAAAAAGQGGIIDLYIDGCDLFSNLPGTLIGTCEINPTGGEEQWVEFTADITKISGVHDLYLRFRGREGGELFHLDSFTFQ